ncbi:MAG TPA: ABC transporter ATP-binding protein [Desulfomicrobiaceae bacterium]|nr:ABC transporter ATP-binding protein [Desulfomicrobiaceae bacterium]
MPILRCHDIWKSYPDEPGPTLAGVDLDLDQGRILCLLGPSGCGKTTLLRTVAGLEPLDRGRVIFDGRNMADVPVHKRRFGMMFQDFALFPHKRVFDNVAFGLRMLGGREAEVRERVLGMLELVGLSGAERKAVDQLSGGQRQRVALARSLAPEPRLLMLDEPFSSLDRTLRDRLLVELRRILRRLRTTSIFVTHDQGEAFAVADEVSVMHEGRIMRTAAPRDLYARPGSAVVARFLGFENILSGRVVDRGMVRTSFGVVPVSGECPEPGEQADLLIRPEAGRVLDGNEPGRPGDMIRDAEVVDCLFRGGWFQLRVRMADGSSFSFRLPDVPADLREGSPVRLAVSGSGIMNLTAGGK